MPFSVSEGCFSYFSHFSVSGRFVVGMRCVLLMSCVIIRYIIFLYAEEKIKKFECTGVSESEVIKIRKGGLRK